MPTNKRWRAILPWVIVQRAAVSSGLDGKYRLFRYSHWIPAQWREFHELYEFARMRGWQREQLVYGIGAFAKHGRVVRAGIFEDIAADAPRLRQLHAGSGRVGRPATRRLDADARRWRRRRPRVRTFVVDLDRHRRTCAVAIGRSSGGHVLFLDASPHLRAHRRADAVAARAGRRQSSSPVNCRERDSACC